VDRHGGGNRIIMITRRLSVGNSAEEWIIEIYKFGYNVRVTSILVDSTGHIYAGLEGWFEGYTASDAPSLFLKISPNGELVYKRRIGKRIVDMDFGENENYIIITGPHSTDTGGPRVTKILTSDGSIMWTRSISTANWGPPISLAVLQNNGFGHPYDTGTSFITGLVSGSNSIYVARISMYGSLTWGKTYAVSPATNGKANPTLFFDDYSRPCVVVNSQLLSGQIVPIKHTLSYSDGTVSSSHYVLAPFESSSDYYISGKVANVSASNSNYIVYSMCYTSATAYNLYSYSGNYYPWSVYSSSYTPVNSAIPTCCFFNQLRLTTTLINDTTFTSYVKTQYVDYGFSQADYYSITNVKIYDVGDHEYTFRVYGGATKGSTYTMGFIGRFNRLFTGLTGFDIGSGRTAPFNVVHRITKQTDSYLSGSLLHYSATAPALSSPSNSSSSTMDSYDNTVTDDTISKVFP
jgi:hypothetical protein